MSTSPTPTLGSLVEWLKDALAPLVNETATPEEALALLAELGIQLDVAPPAVLELSPSVNALVEAVDALTRAVDGGAAVAILESVAVASQAASDTVAAVMALGPKIRAEVEAASIEVPDLDTLGTRLLDRLLVGYVGDANPALLYGLELLGIADVRYQEPTTPGTTGYVRYELVPERLGEWIDDPRAQMAALYGWGTAGFDGSLFLRRLAWLLRALEVRVSTYAPSDGDGSVELRAPIFDSAGQLGAIELGVALLPLAAGASGNAGLGLGPYAAGEIDLEAALSPEVTLTLTGDIDRSGDVLLAARPPAQFSFETRSGAGATAGRLGMTVRWSPPGGITFLSHGALLTWSAASLELGIDAVTANGSVSPAVACRLLGCEIAIGSGDGDSFLQSVLPADGLRAELDLGARFSPGAGLTFEGSGTLIIDILIDLTLGPITIGTLHVGLALPGDGSAELTATVDAGFALGPFAAVVEEVGVALPCRVAEAGGNVGPFQIDSPRFVPPHGLGLALTTDAITGGGYLYLDAEKGEYAGVGELAMLGVGITAIGLLATKLPDGQEGWSMFLSLSITFTGLQLGFGFTLNGLGGLVGVNRGLDEDALAEGVRTGALDAILFPRDPIADAPRILADIGAVFPPVPGQFVFGPIAKIGWGTPTLVTLDLGIVIQLPEPLTVSLLGSLEALLPTQDAAVIELRLDVAGTLNITEGTLKIDASLRDSRVLTLELTGDLAVRASFLDDPTFLMAFGGFHPDFVAPADFPELQLLAVALDTGATLRIQLGGYFALTSNSLQFGAELSLWVKALGFTAEGGTTFDALVYFAPFGFAIDLRLWVSIKAGSFDLLGVELTGELTGPNPWYVAGSATFKLLGIKKSLDLEVTVGDREADAPEEVVYVEALLIAELQLPDAWSTLPPTGDGDPVVPVDGDSDARQVHPAGRIEVRQRVVPLGTRIDHYGNASLGGADSFALTAPRIGTQPVAASDSEDVQDFFAAAQYFELAEDEKLSAPSFEQMNAGIRLGDDGIEAGRAAAMTFDHEVVYRDPNVRSADRETTGTLFVATQTALSRAVALGASLGARTAARLPRSTKSVGAFAVQPMTFVALKTDMGVVAGELTPAAGTSFFAARDSVMGANNPNRAVVPAYVLELVR